MNGKEEEYEEGGGTVDTVIVIHTIQCVVHIGW